MSALHSAVKTKDEAKLLELIREGADLEAVGENGQTALLYAVLCRNTDMVKALLTAGANPSTPMSRPWLGKDDSSPLMIAAAQGLDSIVEMLVAHGADVNYRRSACFGKPDNRSALDVAVWHGNWALARLLVEAGADMAPPSFMFGKADDRSPLIIAAAHGQSELVELMLVKGADPNYASTKFYGDDRDWTALHAATDFPATMTIRVLCEWGADVNAISRTHTARTPLHMAATGWYTSSAAVLALVNAGADPFALNVEGRTVVEAMADRGNGLAVEVLLDSRPSTFD